MSIRHVVNGYVVTTYKCGSIYETAIINKYGQSLRYKTDLCPQVAEITHSRFISLCKEGNFA